MILNLDASQLEWRTFVDLSQDKQGIEEINNGLDFHSDNQKKFNLPSRLIAKVFLFRNIFCPYPIADQTAFAYSVDNDFRHIGGVKFWRRAIDNFWEKYQGGYNWHLSLIREAQTTGQIVSKTGRIYEFEPRLRKGKWEWPLSDIANYPVQGYSADIMKIARITAFNRLKQTSYKYRFINTVHDSLVLDVDEDVKACYNISIIVKKSFRDVPQNFKRLYGSDILVPMDCDSKIGINWLWQHKLNIKQEDI